jgi:hypothetical protein
LGSACLAAIFNTTSRAPKARLFAPQLDSAPMTSIEVSERPIRTSPAATRREIRPARLS